MRRPRGFTLIEMAVVVAIISVVAAMSVGVSRAAVRNSNLSGAVFDLAATVGGMRATAMAASEDHLLVVVDAPGDASDCTIYSSARCMRWFILRNPTAAWVLDNFNPALPGVNADFVSSEPMPKGLHLGRGTPPAAAPAPFAGVPVFTTALSPTITACNGGASSCFAIRFDANGVVRPVYRSGQSGPVTGYCFGVITDQQTETRAADKRAVVVAFPTGIVKTFSY